MDSPVTNGKQQHDESAEDGESLDYGEDFLKDELSLTEGGGEEEDEEEDKEEEDKEEEEEEDLEATVKAIQDRTKIDDSVIRTPCPTSRTHQHLSVLDFLRIFLFQRGMTETLVCFEAEWAELQQKGEVDTKEIDLVLKVYTESLRLDGELKNAWREKEEYRGAACVAVEALQRAQRARDAHRLRHQRVIQEKNRLIGEIKKLKLQCDSNQSEVKRMGEKYQVVSKKVLQVALERDKALQGANQGTRREASLSDHQ